MVDDGSTDDTPQRLAENGDPRLRVFRHEQSRGVAAARNRGLEEARGEWIGFHDDDDLWAPRKLRTQLDALAESEALFCYGAAVVLDVERSAVWPDQPPPDPEELPAKLLRGNVLPGGCSNVVVRTSVAREMGGFDERLSMLADWDLWLRLADKGRAVACPEVLVAYRWHSRNMTGRQSFARKDREFEYFISKQRSQHGGAFDATAYSRWLAAEAPGRLQAARVHLRASAAYRSPGDVVRALAVLVAGPRGTRAGRRARAALRGHRSDSHPAGVMPVPDWLEPHRVAGEPS